MTHRTGALLAATALLAVPATAAAQSGPPTPHSLSIAAEPNRLVFGAKTTLAGQLTGADNAGETVTLQEDPFPYGDFKNSVSTLTGADGRWTVERAPTQNVRYRAEAKSKSPATSPEVLVLVAPRIGIGVSDKTPRPGQRVTFSGSVAPAHDGVKALIQRRTSSGKYRTVGRANLVDAGDAHSTYRRTLAIERGGLYRVVLPSHDDHATGKSRRVRLTLGD